jgi:hypothetical protein
VPAFLSAVLRERLSEGIRAGIVAAAATIGVLIGFGIVRGAPLLPLNSIAHTAFGTRAYLMQGFDLVLTSVAVIFHVVSVVLWAIIFALVAARLRGAGLLVGSLVFALVAYVVDQRLISERLKPGFEKALSTPEIAVVYLVLALSLALGLHWARVAKHHA